MSQQKQSKKHKHGDESEGETMNQWHVSPASAFSHEILILFAGVRDRRHSRKYRIHEYGKPPPPRAKDVCYQSTLIENISNNSL